MQNNHCGGHFSDFHLCKLFFLFFFFRVFIFFALYSIQDPFVQILEPIGAVKNRYTACISRQTAYSPTNHLSTD